jgi:hypothetical protein
MTQLVTAVKHNPAQGIEPLPSRRAGARREEAGTAASTADRRRLALPVHTELRLDLATQRGTVALGRRHDLRRRLRRLRDRRAGRAQLPDPHLLAARASFRHRAALLSERGCWVPVRSRLLQAAVPVRRRRGLQAEFRGALRIQMLPLRNAGLRDRRSPRLRARVSVAQDHPDPRILVHVRMRSPPAGMRAHLRRVPENSRPHHLRMRLPCAHVHRR